MPKIVYRNAAGKRLPSVTTILNVIAKPALVNYANELGLRGIKYGEQLDELAQIGTALHDMAQSCLTGSLPQTHNLSREQLDSAVVCFGKFLDWRETRDFEVVHAEHSMVSEVHQIGGTCDAIVIDTSGDMEILDFKTGKGIYPDYLYQLAAYHQLALENGLDVKRAWLVRLGRTPDEGFQTACWGADDLSLGWDVFMAAKTLYKLEQEVERYRRNRLGM